MRDGVTRDGGKAHMFGATEDRADAMAFAKAGLDDRHHFRFIISPEDAAEMIDLKAFTRDLASQMESDLGTRLDWIGITHWNTDNPHVHLLVRGVVQDGSDLVISRDYISHNLRSRAEDLVSIELGPKPEHEIRSALAREVDAERWTRLDRAIRMAADDFGFIDCGLTSPASTTRKRAASPSAGCRSWSAWASRRLQGRVSGWSPSRPRAPCAISAYGATSSKQCTGPSPNAVRTAASPTT